MNWPAFDFALARFNKKNNIDWTSRELQDNTASMLADEAFEIEYRMEERDGREILESSWNYIRNQDAAERGRYSDGEKSILFWIFRETFLEHDSPESDSERARR